MGWTFKQPENFISNSVCFGYDIRIHPVSYGNKSGHRRKIKPAEKLAVGMLEQS